MEHGGSGGRSKADSGNGERRAREDGARRAPVRGSGPQLGGQGGQSEAGRRDEARRAGGTVGSEASWGDGL